MKEGHMDAIAGFMARVLVEREAAERVQADVVDFRAGFQKLYYCFEAGLPEADQA
jgi:glycine hydroxymethyltransferase